MCIEPLEMNGYTLACRECDKCVATYKNTWVARCMAEMQTLPNALVVTLTYADDINGAPLGAKVFRYRDVALMWKRLRKAGVAKYGKEFQLRYVIVGEKGTKFGRCHYHGVIFSNHPIKELGEMSGARSKGFALKRRLHWSIWGNGFVEFQQADRKGMAYALKYILKSRMTAKRSKGKGREGKTEYLASSYLWCSKRPAIGATWLQESLANMVAVGSCPSSFRVRVPSGGDWYVSGKLQTEMALYLHEENKRCNQMRGRDLAGWKALVASVADDIELSDTGEIIKSKAWELLSNGEIEETEHQPHPQHVQRSADQFGAAILSKQSAAFRVATARKLSARCGNIRPCTTCAEFLSGAKADDVEQHYFLAIEDYAAEFPQRPSEKDHEFAQRFEAHWRGHGVASIGCIDRYSQWLGVNLDDVRRWAKATPRNVQTSSR